MQIADVIRDRVKSDPRTQVQIARLAKIHPINMNQFATGKQVPKLDALCRIAAVLGMEISVSDSAKARTHSRTTANERNRRNQRKGRNKRIN